MPDLINAHLTSFNSMHPTHHTQGHQICSTPQQPTQAKAHSTYPPSLCYTHIQCHRHTYTCTWVMYWVVSEGTLESLVWPTNSSDLPWAGMNTGRGTLVLELTYCLTLYSISDRGSGRCFRLAFPQHCCGSCPAWPIQASSGWAIAGARLAGRLASWGNPRVKVTS